MCETDTMTCNQGSPDMTQSPHTDVAILGGGLAGLLCAAQLRARSPELTITLFEASAHIGGRARTMSLSGGLCNLGPHALYQGGPLTRTLIELGIGPQGNDPSAHPCLIDDGNARYALPSSPVSMLTSTHLSAHTKWTLSRALLTLQRGAPQAHPRGLSARAWLRSLVGERAPHTLAILEMLLRLSTYSTSLDILRASSAHQQLKRAITTGVLYVDGGWQSIIDGLIQQLTQDPRITIHTETKLTSVHSLSPTHHTLKSTKGEYSSSALICAAPPRVAARLFQTPELAEDLHVTRAACIDLVCTRRRNSPGMVLGLHTPHYYSAHSHSAALTPGRDDMEVIHVSRYLEGSNKDAVAKLHVWLDTVRPGWREEILDQRTSPALKVMHHLPTTGSARSIALPAGLFLAGDWCHDSDELLADAVAYSANATTDDVLRHLETHSHAHAS